MLDMRLEELSPPEEHLPFLWLHGSSHPQVRKTVGTKIMSYLCHLPCRFVQEQLQSHHELRFDLREVQVIYLIIKLDFAGAQAAPKKRLFPLHFSFVDFDV